MSGKTCRWAASHHSKENCDACHDLKDCPFCGGTNIMKISGAGLKPNQFIRCMGCNIGTSGHDTIEQATKAWNTRYIK